MALAPSRQIVTGIRGQAVLFIAVAAVAPLLLFGAMAIRSLSVGTEQTVANGNLAIAQQVALRFFEYFDHTQRILDSVAGQIQETQLADWQRQRVLRNHVIDFPELREIAVVDAAGMVLASSRAGSSTIKLPTLTSQPDQDFLVSRPELDADGLPSARIAVRLDQSGAKFAWIVAELALEELWREVDTIRLGERGYAALIDETGRFIAHGDPEQKSLVASGALASEAQRSLAERLRTAPSLTLPRLETSAGTMVAVAAPIRAPQWTVLIEQPESEALAVANRLTRQLYLAIGIALLATVIAGSWWGRSFIRRIFALTTVTEALAAGRMDARVSVTGRDEIARLGRQFNTMADRLVELQDEIRKQERQVMFGRIAAGLVHDLSHPIMTIGNSCKLIQRLYDDLEYRKTFATTVNRELANIKRVLDDLRNVANPVPLARFPVDVNAAVREAVQAVAGAAESAGLTLSAELSPQPLFIEGDLFALGRVFRNLAVNAIQATPHGGTVTLTTAAVTDGVLITVRDTGSGIPADRLSQIFEDFVTTKKHGLGLGLAISRKIVEGLGGRIRVSSEVDRGTTFELEFPRAAAPSVAAAG
jgi:signal transduction histidine kinase